MNRFAKYGIAVLAVSGLFSCRQPTPKEALQAAVQAQIDSVGGEVAVAFLNLSDLADSLFIDADSSFHAASTMKVPVMIELFKQQRAGTLYLGDTIVLVNEFKSIVDGSPYSMDIADDSDDVVYGKIGTRVTLHDLLVPMITVSSNLATNALIERVGAKNVTASMRELGAARIQVLRGVEDQKAYDLGLSNSTTARDLLVIMAAIAENRAGTPEDCQQMIEIMLGQQFNEIIPYDLPEEVRVAHKTGSITALHHDAGIVFLPDGRRYVLVLLSKNLHDFDAGTRQLARVSKLFYDYMMREVVGN